MNLVPPVCCFLSNRILLVQLKHTTRCHRFHNRKNFLPHILCFFWSSSTQWILSSTSITFLSFSLCSDSRTKPIRQIPENRSWKLMSKGGREITSKLNHFYRGREYSGRERPQMLGVQEERSHMSLRGERHVHIWLFAFALIFYSLSSPSIPYKIQGEQDI